MNKKNMFNLECNCTDNIPCCSGYVPEEGSVIFKPSQLLHIKEKYNVVSYSQAHTDIKPTKQTIIKEVAKTIVSLNQNPTTVATPPIAPKPVILPQNQEIINKQTTAKQFTQEELNNIIVGLRTPKPININNVPVRQANRNIFHSFFQNLLKLFKK